MLKSIYILFLLFITDKLKIRINCESLSFDIMKTINYCSDQGYNIKDPNDNFFNDICSIFYSKNKKDVSLEYRRKYFYYPNYEQNILNETLIEEIFPKVKRNSIFSCFKHHFNIKVAVFNLSLYVIGIIFWMQLTSYIFLIIKNYKDASENNTEKYYFYIKNKKKKSKINLKRINQNIKGCVGDNTENKVNNPFSPLKEEVSLTNINKDENIDISESFKNHSVKDEMQIKLKDSLNNNQINNLEDISNELNKNFQVNQDKKLFNNDEIYTFGAVKIKIDENKIQESEIIINEQDNKDNMKYIYNKINNKPIQADFIKKETKNTLCPDELFYSGFSIALLEDKRTMKQIYVDTLSHCQIIFICKQNFFIYEDIRVIVLYYSIKIDLYFIFNIILLNDVSVINKLYDNKLSFSECFTKCLIATIIVNLISQILFIFTNSKKLFIKHVNRVKNSLYNKSNMLQFFMKEIINIINYNLRGKFIILFFLNILIFLVSFYFCLCFCSTYYYTQFIVLINIIISIFISQISPFILSYIPAYLRIKSIQKKSEKLYAFSKFINLFFIP